MEWKRDIQPVIRKTTLAEMDNEDIKYYASITWQQSAFEVEKMRRLIWPKEYKVGMDKTISRQAGLNEDRDDFE